ncbi:MAG TPA: hypothetical protein PLP88_03885 [Bacteroidales bacterium]|nr:hypothetical protein [Bacteroidales bacterium]
MQAYRFRLLFEDQEDFLRDIEIKPNQTFREFHDIIRQCVGLEGNELASFFVCDRKWQKSKEITLIDMMEGEEAQPVADTDDESAPEMKMPISVMDQVRLKDVIEDPHQRFIYEYDFLNTKTFYLELTRILDTDEKKEYPVCVKKEGSLAAAILPTAVSFLDDPDEEAMMKELDDMIKDGGMEEEIDENFTTEPEW